MLIRLRMRLQAAGASTSPILDSFDVPDVKLVRQRARVHMDKDDELRTGLPDDLFDDSDDGESDDDDKPRRVKRTKKPKPAGLQVTRAAPKPVSVRDRLSKKLGIKAAGRARPGGPRR